MNARSEAEATRAAFYQRMIDAAADKEQRLAVAKAQRQRAPQSTAGTTSPLADAMLQPIVVKGGRR